MSKPNIDAGDLASRLELAMSIALTMGHRRAALFVSDDEGKVIVEALRAGNPPLSSFSEFESRVAEPRCSCGGSCYGLDLPIADRCAMRRAEEGLPGA